MRHRRLGRGLMLLAVAIAAMAACGAESRSWAPLPEEAWAPLPAETAMPAAAPDDPAAYRGVRSRMVSWLSNLRGGGNFSLDGRPLDNCGPTVESGGKTVPWLRSGGIEHPSDVDPF